MNKINSYIFKITNRYVLINLLIVLSLVSFINLIEIARNLTDENQKVLNYFLNKQSLPKTQKLTDNLLSKMKKDKNYSFNFKDVVLLQSLRSDGIQIDQIDELSQYKSELNSEIDKMIENKESGMILLKLVEIIGEKELSELNSESLNFVIEIMNRTKLISLRNELLLEILPLKV